jgi:hypothetical protein
MRILLFFPPLSLQLFNPNRINCQEIPFVPPTISYLYPSCNNHERAPSILVVSLLTSVIFMQRELVLPSVCVTVQNKTCLLSSMHINTVHVLSYL